MVTTDHEVAARQPFGLPIARSPVAFASFLKATGIVHDIRVLDGQAGRQAAGAASGSPTRAKGDASGRGPVCGVDRRRDAEELRIRRDMRQLRAMDESMLKDIGLTRADIGTAVRYGRD